MGESATGRPPGPVPGSANGAEDAVRHARREAILLGSLAALRAGARRRRGRERLVASAFLVAAAVASVMLASPRRGGSPCVQVLTAARPTPAFVEIVDEDEALALLAEAGHPSGLATVGGRVIVIPLPERQRLAAR